MSEKQEDASSIGQEQEEGNKYQPPFPPHGTEPAFPKQPGAEALLDAAAQHVFPQHPHPLSDDAQPDTESTTKASKPVDGEEEEPEPKPRESEAENRVENEEQEPIATGTPLDELKTPMLEKKSFQYQPPTSQPSAAVSTALAPPIEVQSEEEEEEDTGKGVRGSIRRQDTTETLRPSMDNLSLQSSGMPRRRVVSGDSSGQIPSPSSSSGVPESAGGGVGADGMGSIRLGASALVSALNALPWDDDSSSDSSDEDSEQQPPRPSRQRSQDKLRSRTQQRPRPSRLHSSLHTIRPLRQSAIDEDLVEIPHPGKDMSASHEHGLEFPFRQNVIARHARSPGPSELAHQFAEAARRRKGSLLKGKGKGKSSASSSASSTPPLTETLEDVASGQQGVKQLTEGQVAREETLGELEEEEEIARAVSQHQAPTEDLAKIQSEESEEVNLNAALREEDGGNDVIEERMEGNITEKKRLRREKLSEKLMEVFGLEEREEVLDEMKCWLLRSVMLKGYMYLTKAHICFFAHMPDRENVVVKTGPLYKKASRTKINTKFWVVLRNDVLSWFESTADPYFPKGNISLQYASSCDVIDETHFKLRTSERNYTFTAESEASRDEWIKAIKKVMFKTQHEGECVKLIIPLDAVMDIEKAPTLEFAETIEVKCVDSEDQMSLDSYFFACFQDPDLAFKAIQRVLDERGPSDLPRVPSPMPFDPQQQQALQPSAAKSDDQISQISTTSQSSTKNPLKKIGSVLKPIIPGASDSEDKTSDDNKSGLSIPFISKTKSSTSHDSLETLRSDRSPKSASQPTLTGEGLDGYPPKQSGPPPASFEEQKGWSQWIKKPATKILGTSPSSTSLFGKTPPKGNQSKASLERYTSAGSRSTATRADRQRQSSVTEIVEPFMPAEDEEADDESSRRSSYVTSSSGRRGSSSSGTGAKFSWTGEDGRGEGRPTNKSDYDMMERSESGTREDEEIVKKFHNVFSLSEKEELIDHFPGYLYRVLPVSGRFFVSTNYFCFRSSQLLYKTKMIIPIRDLYGLKAQKAFRFGHSGLIVVIKGHEEIFLEFSSSKRRKACIALLEERMEETRLRNNSKTDGSDVDVDPETIHMRIMEDLDESTPVEARGTGQNMTSPSPLFGSMTSTFLEFKPDPMRITCLTIGSRGDVQPYIALCKGLQAEGHHTRIATHGEYKDWVEGHGIEFASVGGDPAELMQMCVDNGMFTVSFIKEGLHKFRGWLDDLLNSSWKACQGSDLLIESPSAMGGIHIAEALRIPYFRAFTMPWTRTRAYPHAFAVPEHKRGGSYNYMTYTMFDQVFWRAISGQINRFRKTVLEIDTTNFDKLEQHKVPFLYNFSPNVVPPPLDWTEWIHVTGYWFLENADENSAKQSDWKPPQDLLDFIDNAHKNDKKVVYIGFGSIVVSDPEAMTKCVVDAVVDSGVCAILSKGWSDRGSKAKGDTGDSDGADGVKYPPEIFAIDSIDHSWLFPRIDAACHHGGAGTSGASLRAGIPTIIKPFFGDQAFWSERVESLNVGSAVRKLTSENLAEALRAATADEKQVAKAKVVGEMIRKENGVARAIEAIYRDLEYAKSLIKPPPEEKDMHKTTSHSILKPLTAEFSRPRSRDSRASTPGTPHRRNKAPGVTQSQPQSRPPSGTTTPSRTSHRGGNGDATPEASDSSSWDVLSEGKNGAEKDIGWISSPDIVERVESDKTQTGEDGEKGGRDKKRTGSGSFFSNIIPNLKDLKD